MSNSFGRIFKLTTFGESHGVSIGGIIEGLPSNFQLDIEFIQKQLDRRKPGQSTVSTERKEGDKVEFLSGIFEGKTTGTPIGFVIHNKNQKSKDYSKLKDVFRPSHADYVYQEKYGIRDYRGGGRSSARETACRVVAGAMAMQYLLEKNIEIKAYVSQIHNLKLDVDYQKLDLKNIDGNIVRCPDENLAEQMIDLIAQEKEKGDTLGGVISCVIKNVPIGLGEPVFDKLNARLAFAMIGINAAKGFEIGSGFSSVNKKGSQHNDNFIINNSGEVSTTTNNSGGIQGGISNGQDIYFNVAFKPVSSIKTPQKTINNSGGEVDIQIEGRHDPCVVPRAVPIVEAMAAITILDFLLINKTI